MSSNYEMMYILRPDLLEEQVHQQIKKYRDFLADYNSEEIEIKNLGKRRLAYPIKRYHDGIYVQMNYKADGKQVAPLERAMRLSDEVIRYLTLKLSDKKVVADESEAAEVAPIAAPQKPEPVGVAPIAAPQKPEPVGVAPIAAPQKPETAGVAPIAAPQKPEVAEVIPVVEEVEAVEEATEAEA